MSKVTVIPTKITELIKQLLKFKQEYGNMDVYISHSPPNYDAIYLYESAVIFTANGKHELVLTDSISKFETQTKDI